MARIAFSDEPVTDDKSPCPSLWFRPGHVRDRWHGNVVHTIQEQP